LNLPNFRRKLDDLGILEEVPGATKLGGRNRPAQLYRLKKQFRSALSVRERGL
jgi:8-oxo-dGTP diphosphatase